MTTYLCDGVDSKAYGGYAEIDTFENDQAEFTSGEYTNIQTINAITTSYSTELLDKVGYHHFDFVIPDDIGTISKIDIEWVGTGYSADYAMAFPMGYDVDFSLHVKENGVWTRKVTGTEVTGDYPFWAPSIQTLTTSKTSNFDEWITAGHLHIGTQSDNVGRPTVGFPHFLAGKDSTIKTDYVEVVITTTTAVTITSRLYIKPGIKLHVYQDRNKLIIC